MIKREGNKLFIGSRLTIRAERFPWQIRKSAALLCSDSERKQVGHRYGWKATDGMGRFGGGWNYQLGFAIGKSSATIYLLFGYLSISWYQPK